MNPIENSDDWSPTQSKAGRSTAKNIVRVALLGTIATLLVPAMSRVGFSADRGSLAEAKAMLAKAVAHYKAVGRKQALADFTARKPPFADRDLYVVCFDQDRTVVANGGFPGNMGTPGDVVVDVNGKGSATAAWDVSNSTGEGTVYLRWVNPVTRNVESKTMYFARVGTDICGVGAYTPK